MNALQQLINQSGLEGDEKKDFLDFLSNGSEDQIQELTQILLEDPSLVEKFYSNYKAKEIVFSSNNKELWQAVLEGEKRELEKLSTETP
jgi:hypothetical protein